VGQWDSGLQWDGVTHNKFHIAIGHKRACIICKHNQRVRTVVLAAHALATGQRKGLGKGPRNERKSPASLERERERGRERERESGSSMTIRMKLSTRETHTLTKLTVKLNFEVLKQAHIVHTYVCVLVVFL